MRLWIWHRRIWEDNSVGLTYSFKHLQNVKIILSLASISAAPECLTSPMHKGCKCWRLMFFSFAMHFHLPCNHRIATLYFYWIFLWLLDFTQDITNDICPIISTLGLKLYLQQNVYIYKHGESIQFLGVYLLIHLLGIKIPHWTCVRSHCIALSKSVPFFRFILRWTKS